jgi:mannose-6-phosphate isomerase-like protein (cupin superfamily)
MSLVLVTVVHGELDENEEEMKLDMKRDLPGSDTSVRFEGDEHGGGAGVSFFVEATPPGLGPRLHRHPYAEVFIVQDGTVTFSLDDDEVDAGSGEVVVVPAGAAHKFRNSGERPIAMTCIHAAPAMSTEWLEDA